MNRDSKNGSNGYRFAQNAGILNSTQQSAKYFSNINFEVGRLPIRLLTYCGNLLRYRH